MPASKLTGTRGLAKVREERAALDKLEKQYRREAAIELGETVLAVGIEDLDATAFKALLTAAKRIGPARAIELLKAAKSGTEHVAG